jgi:hypothetical protein
MCQGLILTMYMAKIMSEGGTNSGHVDHPVGRTNFQKYNSSVYKKQNR